MGLKCVVLVGSVRSDRQGIKAARYVERSLTARGNDVAVVDPVIGSEGPVFVAPQGQSQG